MTTIKLEEVQGIVFTGFNKHMANASYYMLQIEDAGKTKSWLKNIVHAGQITNGAEKTNDSTKNCLNLAFSYEGFSKLNMDSEQLNSFELSFREGMYSAHRSALLGDRGTNDPLQWNWGSGNKKVDVLLLLFSKNDAIHAVSCSNYERDFKAAGLKKIQRLEASVNVKNEHNFSREHFGFADGITDTQVEGFPTNTGTGGIATGEFLLGYPNQYDGKKTEIPFSEKFGTNGTYLVFRQLRQNIGEFWKFIKEEAARQNIDPELLAAKFVGRWKSGAVLRPGDRGDSHNLDNNFTFANDQDGAGCPLGAHIRRANPRGAGLGESEAESLKVSNRHRILRRARNYGSFLENPSLDTGVDERGLLFICLNANIERQFEFVQHTWINNVKFAGLYDEDDPLIGSAVDSDRNFTIQAEPFRRRVSGFQKFVTMRGGAYFFLPSLSALKMLADT